ncbi:MAG: hypothetical protein ABI400_08400 [Lacisediminihabitans sp.]
MMAEQAAFDPRFDPAFQRGYEPSAQAPAKRPSSPELRPEELVGPPPPAGPKPDGESRLIDPVQSAADDAPEERQGINPYVVVLWVVGVVFALGGAGLLFVGYLTFSASGSIGPAEIASLQALYALANTFGAPLITVGLATIAGLFFFSAWTSWHRKGGLRS